MKFYKCKSCGKIMTMVKPTAVPTMCCGAEMTELVPGSTDAAQEKHVPVIAQEGTKVTVTVGSVAHPMAEEHYIEWIILETTNGSQKRDLKPGAQPTAEFALTEGEEAVAAYEHCNLHGLWKA